MNCLDCSSAGQPTTAVAVCHSCGAAVCALHAVVRDHHLIRTAPINKQIIIEPAARLVWCSTCAAAHDAAAHHDAHHGRR